MSKKETLYHGLNQQEVDGLKATYGKVILIEVDVEENATLYYFFKPADMATLSATATVAQKDPMKAAKVVVKNCCVRGDIQRALSDASVLPAIAQHMDSVLEVAKSRVKKL